MDKDIKGGICDYALKLKNPIKQIYFLTAFCCTNAKIIHIEEYPSLHRIDFTINNIFKPFKVSRAVIEARVEDAYYKIQNTAESAKDFLEDKYKLLSESLENIRHSKDEDEDSIEL